VNSKDNKYRKWYDQIIDRARNRTLTGYVERHHIVPRSLGGTDDPGNLVNLTAREHLICHMLLPRFVEPSDKMWNAVWRMMNCNRYTTNARVYQIAKKQRSKAMSALLKGKTWEELYGVEGANTRRLINGDPYVRAKISAALKGITSSKKGKTYEEIYGPERSILIKEALSKRRKGYKQTPEHIAKRCRKRN